MKDIRAAVIGLGGMGRRHVAALDGLADLGVRTTAVCDMNIAAAQEFAAARAQAGFAAPAAHAHWREALAAGGVDLLCVATNGPSHRDIVLAAAEAKIPFVLCEKPMSTSGAAAREMAAACEAAARSWP
jgi:predicted dehydrogenase